ncbi:MAG: 16S rRNA (guanine(966)-N(2))-methyltransferase RsmD [Longimicrobiales bacterium]|nr:16S rRNA (guanine(966)-N(2))-methyltransferase RsmD [Longimicrobiales bacterium]
MRIIAGQWRGRRLKAVRGRGVRPTADRVREAWMAAIGWELEGARVLDLFAGSGALGLEALSRGATEVVFVERSRTALVTLRGNVELLKAEEECRIVAGDAMAFVRRLPEGAFDLVLADPPYDLGLAGRLLELFAEKGFARELWVEHRSTEGMPSLPELRQRRYGDTTLSILKRDV